ncbi:MAG: hypothetical protein ACI9BN_001277 [Francisella sp.]|jgi:hypothetical protein
MLGILSLASLCFAEGKPDASDEVDLSIIKLKNDTNGKDNLNATFDVKYAGITKKLAPAKSIEIYHVDPENSAKACSTNKFGEFNCNAGLYIRRRKIKYLV